MEMLFIMLFRKGKQTVNGKNFIIIIYQTMKRIFLKIFRFVTLSEFKYPFFPNYCNGASCLFTKEAAKSILYNAPKVKYFWIDDVLFMGIIPMVANIELVDMKESFGSTDLTKYWQATCDFFNYSGLISFYLNDEDFEEMDELFIKCPPVQWFWKHFSASRNYNLELFF